MSETTGKAAAYGCARMDCGEQAVVVYQGINHPAIYGSCANHMPWENPANHQPRPIEEFRIIHDEVETRSSFGGDQCVYGVPVGSDEDGALMYYECKVHGGVTIGNQVPCEAGLDEVDHFTDGTYDCPHGCPLVIFPEDVEYHKRWHQTSH
jgi:hypothetical protein